MSYIVIYVIYCNVRWVSTRCSRLRQLLVLQKRIIRMSNVNVLHLYSAICIASEALLVNRLYSAPSQGRLRSAGWVSNTTHYDCCHYRRIQKHNPFGQPGRITFQILIFRPQVKYLQLDITQCMFSNCMS